MNLKQLLTYTLFTVLSICTHDLPVGYDATPGRSRIVPPLRAHHALIYDGLQETILMTGGSTPIDSGRSSVTYNDLWNFDGREWKSKGSAGDERSSFRLAYDSRRKKIYSFGGYSEGRSLSDLRVLENNNWKMVADLPQMKAAEPGFVYDEERDRLIVFGGSAARGETNAATWEWDGSNWKKLEGAGPEGRQAFMMVYDSKRKKMILFGGMGNSPEKAFNDTWEYDGKQWAKVNEQGPGPRFAAGYTHDTKRGLFIIFGGIENQKRAGDTWSWNGTEWKKLADDGPPARAMGYMEYDKKRDRIVLFGGRMGWPIDANDTWEWNGKQWTQIKM
jgi:hypothetical protein